MLQPIDFGRETCGNYAIAARKEWLITNGIGGYASGTIAGVLTRRYHGILLAALEPPLGRTLLVAKLNETVEIFGYRYPLYCDCKTNGIPEPQGYLNLERFYLDGTTPVWHYVCAGALVEKRIWMHPGKNTTYIRYQFLRSIQPTTSIDSPAIDDDVHIHVAVLLNHRDYHSKTRFDSFPGFNIERVDHGLAVNALIDGAQPFYVYCKNAAYYPKLAWDCNHYLAVEAQRGESEIEDHFTAGVFQAGIHPGESLTIIATTDPAPVFDSHKAYQIRQSYEKQLLQSAGIQAGDQPDRAYPSLRDTPAYARLVLAADQFIVSRPSPSEPQGSSIIAGYPWFSDWGRDTMISLPGLTLATGRTAIARSILRTYAQYVDQGMLPNRFPDAGEQPEYNTMDATLWYFEAIRQYYCASQDRDLLQELFPRLEEIISWHFKGTRYRIKVDPADGLLSGGEPGVQLTWMDAKVDDWVVTPRIGKPVEINALWYNALCTMEWICQILGKPPQQYRDAAGKLALGFGRFWNPELGYCYDTLDGPAGNDPSLRPNQLLAVSLKYSPLNPEQQRSVLNACAHDLLTSHGLRSLAQHEPGYIGSYAGTRYRRDAAYHQGTVWGWLIGPFVSAHWKVYQDPQAALSFIQPLIQHLSDHGLGSISEIFDGDAPFNPDGCIAQAWSVAELLRVMNEIGNG